MVVKMRLMTVVLYILLFATPLMAQEEVFADPNGTLIWLDNETLLFELDGVGYHYAVGEQTLTTLEQSPFRLYPTEDDIAYYQIECTELPDCAIPKSPYVQEGIVPIIYSSTLTIQCGSECYDNLNMVGRYDTTSPGIYHPFDVNGIGLRVEWAASSATALVLRPQVYGCCYALFLVHLEIPYPSALVGFLDVDGRFFALSPDGSQILYSSYCDDAPHCLHWWQAHLPTEVEPWLTEAEQRVYPLRDQTPLIGAGFIPGDDEHILMLDSTGIVRFNLNTGEREILNNAVTQQGYLRAVFSPDAGQVALIDMNGHLSVVEI
jgi:hypothetical protein